MDFLVGNISTIKKKQDNFSNEFIDNENDNNFISKSEVDKKINEKKEKFEIREENNKKRESNENNILNKKDIGKDKDKDRLNIKENKIKEITFSSKENKNEKNKNKNIGKENNSKSVPILEKEENKLIKTKQVLSKESINHISFAHKENKEMDEENSNNFNNDISSTKSKKKKNHIKESVQIQNKNKKESQLSKQYIEDNLLKKQKIINKENEIKNDFKNEEIRGYRKSKNGKMQIVTESQFLRQAFIRMQEEKPTFKLVEEDEDQFFGVNNRYSLRARIPRLNRIAGERIQYTLKKDPILGVCLPSMIGVIKNKHESAFDYASSHRIKPKKKKLKKGLKKIKEEQDLEDLEDMQSDNNFDDSDDDNLPVDYDQENDSDRNEDIVMIPSKSQKGASMNFDVTLNCEIMESQQKNKFIIDKQILRNLKQGDKFFVSPSVVFNFLNYSSKPLRVKVVVLNDKIK